MLTRFTMFPSVLRYTYKALEVGGRQSIKCRCFCFTPFLRKKNDKEMTDDEQRLEREAPFLFKAIKNQKDITSEEAINYEAPLIFQPIRVKKSIVEDDLSHLGHDVKSYEKKENVFVIQPHSKWGSERIINAAIQFRLNEAEALIDSVQSWDVHTSSIEPLREQNPKFFFGTGKVFELSKTIRNAINNNGVTMVFLNTAKLSLRQIKELEAIWGCKVFDRYRVILELFKERAITKEAKLQVHLAELQYMKTHLVTDSSQYDQQKGGMKGVSGAGETQLEIQRRRLAEDEHKTRKALQEIKSHRMILKSDRIRKRVPQVAMIGYTNAGKTTLTKALSQDNSLIAKDQLFATLDTTAHRGKIPCGLNLVFIDTVGFISDLPHELVESFSTTLEDATTADLLIHVADCSHPEFKLQFDTVERVLSELNIPEETLKNKITVLNKVDLGSQMTDIPEDAITISAVEGDGIEKLRNEIESKILRLTGREYFNINIDLHGKELSWLYRHGTVTDTSPRDDGTLDVGFLLEQAMKNKCERELKLKLF